MCFFLRHRWMCNSTLKFFIIMYKTRSVMAKKTCQLPSWLWSTSKSLPPLYRLVWEAVREQRFDLGIMQSDSLVDTNKVFPLLLTSQLPTEVLGYIWSLANQKYAGQLTEQELYIILALIAIAQTSYTFTDLNVLHMLPGPPIPRLDLTSLYTSTDVSQSSTLESNNIIELERNHHDISDCKGIDTYSSTTIIPSSIINSSNIAVTRLDLNPLIVSPNKNITDVLQMSSNHENGRQSGITATDLSDDFSDFQSAPIQSPSSISIWDSKQGSAIGSRLANHNLSNSKRLSEKKKSPASKEIHGNSSTSTDSVLNSPVINRERLAEAGEDIFSKCIVKNHAKTTVILKDTAIRSEPLPPTSNNLRDINSEKFTEFASISNQLRTPNSKISEGSPQDLMNLQTVEDKYSALRILVDEPARSPIFSSSLSASPESSDDFGDFVSAEKIEPTTEMGLDLFSDFEQFLPNSGNDNSAISFTQETIEAFAQLEIIASPEKTINFLEKKYEMTIDADKLTQKEDTISINSIELVNNAVVMTRSGSVPSLDLKLFIPPNAEDEKEIETMYQSIYWEWKQYMESCILLLQVGANIFMNITSDIVLQEVTNSAQGYNFLCNLAEVAGVCRRVNFSHKEMDINIMGFDDLLMDIDRIWADMEPFYANIPIVTELPAWPLHPGEGVTCALCLTMISSGKIIYNDNVYHLTCANLWLNCVNSNLPILRYSSKHSQSIIADACNSGQL